MREREANIELLYRYVAGELIAEDALFVEQELAINEVWQEVYEG